MYHHQQQQQLLREANQCHIQRSYHQEEQPGMEVKA
jgi:hypothetical protein